ncbi:MAG: cbb3-type cytochrome c oxidase subunit I [Planctomycetes bacterium]|nr:cbb3-type cytochrome c oxidase subunit I [Planctomycetota bacterium]
MKESTNSAQVEHGRIALGYAIVLGLALVAGALLALGLGMQPLAGRGGGASAEGFRRLYSVHGLLLVFLVVLPAIPAVLGNWMLPRALGRSAMALPRLNLLAFQIYVVGALALLLAVCFAPADAGWSFELPYALTSSASLGWSLLAMAVLATSFVCSSLNLFATVIASRGGGRTWGELSPFSWSIAIASLMQLIAVPLLFVALVLLAAQRSGAADVLGTGPAADVRFAQWFWLFGHPALAGALVAALGIVAEVISTHTSGPRAATRVEATSMIAIAVLAFAAAGVHVLGRGLSDADAAGTSALALATGLPFALIVLGWVRELQGPQLRATPALGFALCFLVLLCVGGMSGAFLAVLPTASALRETCFATAQFHYLVVGGTLSALFAGLYLAWPRWFGVEPRAGWGFGACALFFLGINLAFFPLFVLGYLGQPRRSTEIVAGGEHLGELSAFGTALVVVALVITAWNLLSSLLGERKTAEEAA